MISVAVVSRETGVEKFFGLWQCICRAWLIFDRQVQLRQFAKLAIGYRRIDSKVDSALKQETGQEVSLLHSNSVFVRQNILSLFCVSEKSLGRGD